MQPKQWFWEQSPSFSRKRESIPRKILLAFAVNPKDIPVSQFIIFLQEICIWLKYCLLTGYVSNALPFDSLRQKHIFPSPDDHLKWFRSPSKTLLPNWVAFTMSFSFYVLKILFWAIIHKYLCHMHFGNPFAITFLYNAVFHDINMKTFRT